MILKRNNYSSLLYFKKNYKGKKFLYIYGPPRVGKTTLALEFGKNEYKGILHIDLKKSEENIKNWLNLYKNDLDTLFMLLSSKSTSNLQDDSLIIFDNVDVFPDLIEKIKMFLDYDRYDYVLISSKKPEIDSKLIFELCLYPLSFDEFCKALDQDVVNDYISFCFKSKIPLEKELHEKIMMLFKEYLIVGGMPESVVKYIQSNKSLRLTDNTKRSILNTCFKNINEINERYKKKVLKITDNIPYCLSKHEKRFIISRIIKGDITDEFIKSVKYLDDSMLIYPSFKISDRISQNYLSYNNTQFRLYLFDTGILLSLKYKQSELTNGSIYEKILTGKFNTDNAVLLHNCTAQMLIAKGYDLFFYNSYNKEKKRNELELDFIIKNKADSSFNTLTIKTGTRTTEKTYEIQNIPGISFTQRFIIYPDNLKTDNNSIYIPPYMIPYIS